MSTDAISRPSAGNSNSDDLSDAAASGETDLRELIYQSLERDGLLSRLKAQLRAAVFTTIEKASSPSAASSQSTFHPVSYAGANGRLARAIVLDWLACSNLSYTEDVLKVETSGPQHPPALSRQEVLEQLPVKSAFHDGQPILYTLLNQLHHAPATETSVQTLPSNVQESIDGLFARDRTIEFDRLRQHFHSVFSSIFDLTVLNAYLEKNSSPSFTKPAYENLCLNWMKSCAQSLHPTIRVVPQSSPPNTYVSLSLSDSDGVEMSTLLLSSMLNQHKHICNEFIILESQFILVKFRHNERNRRRATRHRHRHRRARRRPTND